MPSISGIPVLDVAIGLILVFFLFSLVASALNEMLASVLNLRARYLEQGVRSMLAGPGSTAALLDAIAEHRLVNSLVRSPPIDGMTMPWRRKWPSYLPSRTFALVVLDTLSAKGDSEDLGARAKAALQAPEHEQSKIVAALPDEAKQALATLLDDARGDAVEFRKGLERWFDDTMDRVSGWYKRRVQLCLLLISVLVVCAFNVDTIQIANSLLNDKTLRTAVAAQAQKAAQVPTTAQDGEEKLELALKNVDGLEALKLPIGWKSRPDENARTGRATTAVDPRWFPDSTGGWFAKVFGLLLSGLALSLGAPFWFDLLNRVARLRNTGLPEGGPRERRPRAEGQPSR